MEREDRERASFAAKLGRGPAIADASGQLHDLLRVAAEDFPDTPHIQFRDLGWTFGESARLVDRLAAGLQARGLQKGDSVGLMMSNCPAYLYFCFALWRIGAVGVGLNPLYPDERVAGMLRFTKATLLVVLDHAEMTARAICKNCDAEVLTCRADALDLTPEPPVSLFAADTLGSLLRSDQPLVPTEISRCDLAMLQFTGGTTGFPKAAMLSHGNLLSAIAMGGSFMTRIREGADAWSAIAPLTHVTGLVLYAGVVTAFANRCIIVERFNPAELLEQLRDGMITVLTAIPTMITALLSQPAIGEIDWSRLSLVMAGGAPIPLDVQSRFIEAAGRPVLQAYGLTESAAAAAAMPEGAGKEYLKAVGKAAPGVEISVRDLNACDVLAEAGTLGEICLRGPNVIAGYLNDPAPAEHWMTDGYFRTGDVGRVDHAGFLFVEDRLKDIIICSGYNVYPRVIEEAVQACSGVGEVVAVSLPDAYRGETVAVAVALVAKSSLTLEGLQDMLQGRLSPFEMPKKLFLFDALPKTENAKLSRKLVRDIILSERQSG